MAHPAGGRVSGRQPPRMDMKQLSEFSEALLLYLDVGPMTTNELRSAEPGKWSRVYAEMMKLYRKGLVDRLPKVNERIEGHTSILWWRV